ncbi:flagellar biosynthetic protein FliR [Parasalinivibrio latis]|uniref:flagellar biosynthetic protein FliR n=1 Tax=Parasalinivibrio latis TaxID=2952610 RepID=UPI0030E1C074
MADMTAAQFTAWLGQIWWPFLRIGGAMMLMPVFGSSHVPVRIRLIFTLMLAILAAPLMPQMPAVDPFSFDALIFAGQQVFIGAVMALLLDILFAVFTTLGQILSMQMGLGMAVMNDPVNGVGVPEIGKYYQLFALLLFLALDGHLVALDILVNSFKIWAVGDLPTQHALHVVIMRFGWMVGAALLLSLPALVAMLLVNVAFGVMNRAAPQLNIFSLGFPMTLLLGLVCLVLTISGVPQNFTTLCGNTLSLMANLEAAH